MKNIKVKKIFPSKFRESRNKKNELNFLDKKKGLNQIKNKFVYDLETKKLKKYFNYLNEIFYLYFKPFLFEFYNSYKKKNI